jgi:hypothetical protein
LQGYTIETLELKPPSGFTGIHQISRNLKSCTKREKRGTAAHRKRGRGEQREDLLTEEGDEVAGGRWPPVAGVRRNIARSRGGRRETESSRALAGKKEASGSVGLGAVFLKREMGTPDSLQCLSGAHRTAHSEASGSVGLGAVFLKREMGTPDSLQCLSGEPPDSAQENWILARGCRCTGHCTVQCPVHTGLSGEPRQRGVWKILNFSI